MKTNNPPLLPLLKGGRGALKEVRKRHNKGDEVGEE